ncbi:MAG: exodeoxyribonuclease V subunit gamma, partial [Myxococcota bacterium]|nr:exodeoxyribonuclease V subunit gamma [Myxococcota bacterium]
RFALSESDVETVRGFIERASIRFALDGAHRAAHGFGELDENTLMFGLRRLTLGYAVPEQEAPLVCGIAPAGQTSGELAPVLGALAQAAQMLKTHLTKLAGSHLLPSWRALILSAVEDFSLERGRSAHERRAIGETLARFVAIAQEAGLEEPIDATTARALLLPKIVNAAARRDHFRGGVEFASLSAAAGIPARAVFVVGMNDGELPRSVQRSSMDLLSKSPRLLDPSPRAEDQRNVLAALLGARRRFVATYSGVSQQDGTMRAPSVLVDEIIEAAVEVARSSPEDIRKHLVVEHPLSRFAPAYFDGDPLSRVFSTDEATRACAAALLSRHEPSKAISGALAESEAAPESGVVFLEDLVHGLGRPLLHLWTRVLGAGMPKTAMPTLPGYEPAGRDGLAEYELRETLLREAMQRKDPAAVVEVILARGVLPPGELGRARCQELLASTRLLREVAHGLDLGETVADHLVEVDLPAGGHNECVVGVLSGRRSRGRLEVTSSRNPRRLLHAWVRHLAMCGAGTSSAAGTSALVRRGPGDLVETWTMPSLAGPWAVDRLAQLVGLYQMAARVPLRLFSGASFAFSKALFEGKSESTAWDLARLEWQPPGQRAFGDAAEKTITRYLFGHSDFELLEEHPAAPELSFAELSAAVFGPIFEHCSAKTEKCT